jgi:transcriptional regulator
MYVPKYFAVEDRRALLSFIRREPFGILVSEVNGKPYATHAPFVILDEGDSATLGMHVARANPHWRALDGQDVLAIFHGAHGMVSASWYADPQHSVPTWNYSTVHCYGRARVVDTAGTRRIIETLVDLLETGWKIEAADAEYIDRMLQAIVGIEIAVTSFEGKFKHSQNRSLEERLHIVNVLSNSARAMDRELAADMAATLDVP